MTEPLFPYQVEGAKFLAERRFALLADEMGLGKSAQAIRACDLIRAKRVLVLCPAVARINWKREFLKFTETPRSFTIVESRSTKVWADSVICSYDLADTIPETSTFDVVIADEAHYLKSVETKRTRAVLGAKGLIHRTKRFWALSGTPAPNHPGELWPLLFTFGVVKQSFDQFVHEYCSYYVYRNRRAITGARVSAIPQLRDTIAPIMMRRKKEEVMKDLPPIFYSDILVEPGLVDIEIESSFVHYVFPIDRKAELIAKLKKERELVETATAAYPIMSGNGIRTLEAIAQSVSTLRRYIGLQKVEPVAEMVKEELENKAYEKIVIFALHRDVIAGLRDRLRDFKPVTLYGGTPPEKRQAHVDKFQKEARCRVFIGQIHAAGTAITLTASNQVLFIEQDWVPGNNMQAAMRCHRIGQTKPVTCRFVGIAESIDEKIAYVLRRKTAELTRLFDSERRSLSLQAESSLPAMES